ncbi:MAG: amidohydrolase family protein [Proteobacteria bacterium]|nr:amidohydrolase family protein [Pseudomonadota bacterium]
MLKLQRFLLLCIAVLGVVPVGADTTVFVNVNIVPMTTEVVLTGQTVIVARGKIANIGPVESVPIPEDAQIVDGTDRFLMPGLAEMHAHVTGTRPAEIDRLFTLFVANGITTIRGMLGQYSHLDLRARLETGEVFGPRFVTSGPSLNGRSVSSAADAARQVREQHAAGYDFIKVHPGLTAEEFAALAATANELGMPYAGHVPVAAGVREALRSHMATIDHLDGYFVALLPPDSHGSGGFGGFFDVMLAPELDSEKIAALAAATAMAGTWNVPTQVLVEQMVDGTSVTDLRNRSEMRYVPESTVNDWVVAKERQLAERGFDPETAALAIDLRRRLILALHDSGAGLLLGSDAPQIFNVPGFSAHRELDVLVAAGLTPYEALQTGTSAVAKFLGSNTGVVAVGKEADLILLDANPLEDIRNSRRIHGVMLRGQWLPASELEQRLAAYLTRDDEI